MCVLLRIPPILISKKKGFHQFSSTEVFLDPKGNNDFFLINVFFGAGQEHVEVETMASNNAGGNQELKYGPMS
jgi:hypothetical protein